MGIGSGFGSVAGFFATFYAGALTKDNVSNPETFILLIITIKYFTANLCCLENCLFDRSRNLHFWKLCFHILWKI
jgi:hypothetical protein